MLSGVDLSYVRSVQNLSLKHLGLTKENPSVACLIVDFNKDVNGKVISFGLTSLNGRPHAEVNALKKISKKIDRRKLTAYISLEPCFKKKLNSCSTLLYKAGIRRIVIDSLDPNPEIYNKGNLFLKKKKIKILIANSASKFKELNKYFYKYKISSQPFITLKLAISQNGYIKDFNSLDITSKKTQQYLHYLRLRHDAIGVGYNTLIDDQPQLTCRLNGINKHLKKLIFIKKNTKSPIQNKNFQFIDYDKNNLKQSLYDKLSKSNVRSLLVEGGLSTFMTFFKAGCYDEIVLAKSKNNVVSSRAKYKINKNLFDGLLERSNNNYGNDKIIVYKKNNV